MRKKKINFIPGMVLETFGTSKEGPLRFTVIGPAKEFSKEKFSFCRCEYVNVAYAKKFGPIETDYAHSYLRRYAVPKTSLSK